MTLGEKIQLARKKKGMSQEDLASMLNVSRQAVQKWESGASQPEVNNLIQISNMFDVSLDYLLKDLEEVNKEIIKDDKKEENIGNVDNGQNLQITQEKTIRSGKYTVIKVWMIIGCILSPMSVSGSFASALGPYSLLFLVLYAITIPLCCTVLSIVKHSHEKSETVGAGVLSLLLISFIGGIIILTINDGDYEMSNVFVPLKNHSAPTTNINNENKTQISKEDSIEDEENRIALINKRKEKYQTFCTELLERSKKNTENEKKVDSHTKSDIYIKLDELSSEIDKVTGEESYQVFTGKVRAVMEPINNRIYKRIVITVLITIFVLIGIIVSIVVPVSIYNEKAKIKSYYDSLLYEISNYSGSSYDDSNIRWYLNRLPDGYKKRDQIEKDFKLAQTYISTIDAPKNNAVDSSKSENIRQYINYLYSKANTSGLWDYNDYIRTLGVPHLLYGLEFSNSQYMFEWYYDTTTNDKRLSWNLPTTSAYNKESSYFYDTDYSSSTNTFKFYLILQSNNNSTIDLCKINYVYYDKIYGLSVNVYLYGNGTTINMN